MILFRFILIAFNVGIVTFLVYRMLQIARQPMTTFKKTMVILGGLILLLAPLGIFVRAFLPTFQYFLIYPVAVAIYVYMVRVI